MAIGFKLPFSVSSGSIGYFDTTADEISATKEDLKSLMLTNPGERLMQPNLGCGFASLLFENLTRDELRVQMTDKVISQAALWMPFVSLQELDVFFSEDDPSVPENGVRFLIKFILNSKPDLLNVLDFQYQQAVGSS